MEYRQLYYFVCVAREGNFTRAAEKLMISEPSLSKSIKKLEEEFGCQLAVRSSRVFSLTDFGKILYERGVEVVYAFEELNSMAQKYSAQELKEIQIGIPSVLNTILATCISEFISEYSNVKISLIEEGSKVIKEMLLENKIDVGLVVLPVSEKYFDITHVISDRVVAVMSHQHPLAKKEELSIADIKNEGLILLNSDYQIYYNILDAFQSENTSPRIMSTSANWDFLVEIVAQSTKYITLLPRPITEKTGKPIVSIPVKSRYLTWNVVAITRKGDYMPMMMKRLINLIRSY